MAKENMTAASTKLESMADEIRSHHDWWQFPEEPPVSGFMGSGRIFIVGDQPSTSDWNSSNLGRRVFYDTLAEAGLGDAHLTDLYKKRGKASSLKKGTIPDDFEKHIKFFRGELDLLKPVGVIALGILAHKLLKQHVPEVGPKLVTALHFSYVVRMKMTKEEYKRDFESAKKRLLLR